VDPNTFKEFCVLLTVHLGSVLVNDQLDAQFFSHMYIHNPNSLHVSSTSMLIIRRINCINVTCGICHSMKVTVWCASLDGTPWRSIQICTLDGHLHRVTYNTSHINTIDSPDDEHRGARNM
jgi:hypothetical protein